MWRELVQSYTANCTFSEPATSAEIGEVERRLSVTLPDDLRSLLLETDGICVDIAPAFPELGEAEIVLNLMQSASELTRTNLDFQSFEPLSKILFFASAPNGDYLGFPLADGKAENGNVIRVSHEDYSAHRIVASTLEKYLRDFLGFIAARERETLKTGN